MDMIKADRAATNYRDERYRGTARQFAWDDVQVAFVAGAKWQAEQKATPAMPEGFVALNVDRLNELMQVEKHLAEARRVIKSLDQEKDNLRKYAEAADALIERVGAAAPDQPAMAVSMDAKFNEVVNWLKGMSLEVTISPMR